MKELTAETLLAIHALHQMVRAKKPVSVHGIAESSGFSPLDVRRILHKLRTAALVESRPGVGFVAARAPGEISIQDVIRAMGESLPPTAPCGGDFEACASRAACLLAPLCRSVDENSRKALESFTFAELADMPVDIPNCVDPRMTKRP